MKETLLVFSPIIQAGHKEMLPISPRLGCYWGKMEGAFFLLEIFQPSTLIQCHQGWSLFPPMLYVPAVRKPCRGWTKTQAAASSHGFPSAAGGKGSSGRGQRWQGTAEAIPLIVPPLKRTDNSSSLVLHFQHRALNRRGKNPSYHSLGICEPETPSSGEL